MESPVAEGVVLGGRYRLGPLLGQGGMARVFDGLDMRLGRPVAIKVLLPELAASASLRQRFEREAEAAARLSHPNVVGVYDAGEDAGQAYIVMERLGGESLADSIRRGPVDGAWLQRLAGDILAALGAAHAAGIVHRDIKPANILLAADGRAKVADFGIARVIEEQAAAGTEAGGLTSTGLIVGTPEYLAPERMLGRPATAESDIYSVGVVLYEALTGQKPFGGGTPLAVAAAASQGAAGAPDPAALRPGADPRMIAAIARAMAPDPALRFASAAAMASALRPDVAAPTAIFQGASATPSVSAATVPIVRPGGSALSDGVRRRPWVALAAAAAVVLIAVVAALALGGGHSKQAGAANPVSGTTGARTTSTVTTTPQLPATVTTVAGSPTDAVLSLANQLTPAAGPAYQQLVTGLVRLAGLPAIAQPGYATVLLAQAGNWWKQGQLSDAAYRQATAVLTSIAGQPLTTTAPAPKRGKGGGGGGD